jgi:hypothetical protein
VSNRRESAWDTSRLPPPADKARLRLLLRVRESYGRRLWNPGRQGSAGNGRASHCGKESGLRRPVRSIVRRPTLFCLAALAVACLSLAAAPPAPAAAATPVLTFAEGTPEAPFSLQLPLDPALTVGDGPDQQLRLVTPIGPDLPVTAVARSVALDFGKPAQDKEFLSLSWSAVKPRGTNLFINYSVDGRAWLPAVGGNGFDIPRGTHGKTIAYGISMTSGDVSQSPVLDDIVIEYARWTGKPVVPPDGDGGTSHKPRPDHKPGSGTYTYPDAGGPADGGSSAGSGGNPGGSGSGTGSGSSSGSGAGGGSSALVATSGVSDAAAAQPAPIPSPPASAPSGAPQSVSGLPVDAGQTVSGVAFEAAGSAFAADAGRTPAAAGEPGRLPIGPVVLVVAALAAMFFVPWLIAAARLRSITGYDFERARLFGPFWPLGR